MASLCKILGPSTVLLLALSTSTVTGLEPSFVIPVINITVVAGRAAILPCAIDNLGRHMVTWLDSHQLTLTHGERRVIDDDRFTVTIPKVQDWNLLIEEVQWTDQGQYSCTINTNPIKKKVIQLNVQVPPRISEEGSTDDIYVPAGDDVTLTCDATGVPQPKVKWFRRQIPNTPLFTGTSLIIRNISRYRADLYECVAKNGVPPAARRQIKVSVGFPPTIMMPVARIGQRPGKDALLECRITAYPNALSYWKKDGNGILTPAKHKIEAYDESNFVVTLSLHINSIEEEDYGDYICGALNLLGRDEKAMSLFNPFNVSLS